MRSLYRSIFVAFVAFSCFVVTPPASTFANGQGAPALTNVYIPLAQVEGTPPTPSPGITAPLPIVLRAEEQTVLNLLNAYRAENGCPQPLTLSPKLTSAARSYSDDLSTMSHEQLDTLAPEHRGTNGSTIEERISSTGYLFSSLAENISYGASSAKSAIAAWKSSPDHNANMLNCAYTEVGIGYVHKPSSDYKHFWTQDFAIPQ